MVAGIVYKKALALLILLLVFTGSRLYAQQVDATPEITALCNADSSKVHAEFSPNGDGVHDSFSFKPVNMAAMKVVIFDKNRNILYQSDKLDAKWDGYDLKKQKVAPGIYFFIQTALGLDDKKYEQMGCIRLTR